MAFKDFIAEHTDLYSKKRDYEFQDTLGAGSFGTVRKALQRSTKREVAVKIILKSKLHGHLEVVEREVSLLNSVKHPHIVELIDSFQTKHNFYIVTQLATGGELFDRLIKKTSFTEFDACDIIHQMLDAISYLHKRGIVHRDIKPENVLYLSDDDTSPIVLADFGVSKQVNVNSDERLTGVAGSFGYIAPEIYANAGYGELYGLGKHGYDFKCDIWSLGVVAYTLIGGYSPIKAQNPQDFLDEVRTNNFVVFHEKYWKHISDDAKDFIIKSLDIDFRRRPSAIDLLNHPWIINHKKQHRNENETNIISNIQEGFNAHARLRRAVRVVMMKNQLETLKKLREDSMDDSSYDEDADDFSFFGNATDNQILENFHNMRANTGSSRSVNSVKSGDSASSSVKSKKLSSTFYNLVRAAQESPEQIQSFQEQEKREQQQQQQQQQ